MTVYFDHAATTPIRKEVADEMYQVILNQFGNPSSSHQIGRKSKSILELSRKTIAEILNVLPSEIYFTSCGTEANNLILRSCVNDLGIKTIISSKIEHHAVLNTVESLAQNQNINVLYVNLLENGNVDLNHLEQLLIDNQNVLISLMHVNNEIGNVLNIQEVGNLSLKYNALFHSDMVQSLGSFPIDLSKINIDFATGSAHKFNGPKGVGLMFCKKKNKLKPMITGGSQERELRAGTENLYGIVGLAKAFELSNLELSSKINHNKTLKFYMIDKIQAELPEIKFNGDYQNGSYNILNLAFPNLNDSNQMLLFNFDLNGFCVSGGSACSSGSNKGSHVINTLQQHNGYIPIRFSFGKSNSIQDIDAVIEFIKSIVK